MAGNANSGRRNTEKHFLEALKMQLASAGKDHKALRAVASALIEKAQSGDTTAISIIADRLDGKVPQAVEGTGEGGELVIQILRMAVEKVEPEQGAIELVAPKDK